MHRCAHLLGIVCLALGAMSAALSAARAAGPPLPADDAWTESLTFVGADGRPAGSWTWRHEDKDKGLCRPVPGKTLLLDDKIKTTGRASIHFRYRSDEARRIRQDIPANVPRQIYNVLRLPSAPVDASAQDAVEFDLRCEPEGAVVGVRLLVTQRLGDNDNETATTGLVPFVVGREWRRFGAYTAKMTQIGRRKEADGGLDWRKCTEVIIDVRLAPEALKEAAFIDVRVDGLRFVQGESTAADRLAAVAAPPRAAGPFGTLPLIEWEDLGVVVQGRTTVRGSPRLGFSTDRDGWSAYAVYRDHIVKRAPWVFCEINLQTEKEKVFRGPADEQGDTWGFEVFPDGRPYTFPTGGSRGARIARVDWKTGELQVFGPCPDGWNYCWRWGAADDAIYIGGYRKHYAIRFDPDTGEITDYGVQGPPAAGGVYSIAADARYVYTSVGKDVSYLVACDRKTLKQQILGERKYPQSWSLNGWDGMVFAREQPATYENGVPKWREFLVRDAKLEPIAERPARKQSTKVRDAFGVPRPEVLADSAVCLGDGHATLWYRKPGGEWRSVRYKVDDTPSYLFRLGRTPDGRIIGSSEDPYTIFTYDPKTGEKQLLGPSPNMTHVYSFQPHPNGKTYMCGYSGAPLMAWDPTPPWSFLPATPERRAADWKAADVNPLQVARVYRQRRAFEIAMAADGRLYIPCSAYVETLPGGCLGWYDPGEDVAGVIREGFETWRGNDATTASEGRYIVVTTVPWPYTPDGKRTFTLTDPHDLVSTGNGLKIRYRGPEGATGTLITPADEVAKLVGGRKSRTVEYDTTNYLVTYDTRAQRVVGKVVIGSLPERELGVDGAVCEWRPGLVVVRVSTATGAHYGLLDVAAQKLEFKLNLPPAASRNKIVRLPDGRIAAIHDNAIVFIDPADWSYRAVGRLRPLGDEPVLVARDWLLLGDDLYLACGAHLGRIRNVSAPGR